MSIFDVYDFSNKRKINNDSISSISKDNSSHKKIKLSVTSNILSNINFLFIPTITFTPKRIEIYHKIIHENNGKIIKKPINTLFYIIIDKDTTYMNIEKYLNINDLKEYLLTYKYIKLLDCEYLSMLALDNTTTNINNYIKLYKDLKEPELLLINKKKKKKKILYLNHGKILIII